MIKHIAIVSLSSGTIGEDFVRHEVDIGIKRLNDFGITVTFMPHALKGIEYVKDHPAERAADLLQALNVPEIDMILCAIGGDEHIAYFLTCLNIMNWLMQSQIKCFLAFLIRR